MIEETADVLEVVVLLTRVTSGCDSVCVFDVIALEMLLFVDDMVKILSLFRCLAFLSPYTLPLVLLIDPQFSLPQSFYMEEVDVMQISVVVDCVRF